MSSYSCGTSTSVAMACHSCSMAFRSSGVICQRTKCLGTAAGCQTRCREVACRELALHAAQVPGVDSAVLGCAEAAQCRTGPGGQQRRQGARRPDLPLGLVQELRLKVGLHAVHARHEVLRALRGHAFLRRCCQDSSSGQAALLTSPLSAADRRPIRCCVHAQMPGLPAYQSGLGDLAGRSLMPGSMQGAAAHGARVRRQVVAVGQQVQEAVHLGSVCSILVALKLILQATARLGCTAQAEALPAARPVLGAWAPISACKLQAPAAAPCIRPGAARGCSSAVRMPAGTDHHPAVKNPLHLNRAQRTPGQYSSSSSAPSYGGWSPSPP